MKTATMAKLYFSCLLMSFLPLCIGFVLDVNEHCSKCHFHGTCLYKPGESLRCHCDSGYTGDNCEDMQTYNNCYNNIHCLNGGTCFFDQNQVARCTCATGYSGALCASHGPGSTVAHCETRIHCQNGGTCYFNQNHEVACRCPTGYTGAGCQSLSSETTITITTTTTSAASTATTIWATQNPACVRYDPTVRPCRDATPCSQFLAVLCPDPNQAHYCPITCGCCLLGSPSAAILG